jgi:hypothetical protein
MFPMMLRRRADFLDEDERQVTIYKDFEVSGDQLRDHDVVFVGHNVEHQRRVPVRVH